MGIALSQSVNRVPILKRRRIGQTFTGVVVRTETRVQRDRNGIDKTKSNGQPARELIVHLLAVSGDMPAGIGDEEGPVAPWSPVRDIFKGRRWGAWIDAEKALGRPLMVGDVYTVTLDSATVFNQDGDVIGNYKTQEQVDKHRLAGKGGTIGMDGPISLSRGTDASWTQKAEEAYYAAQDATRVPAGVDSDEEPF